MINVSELKDKYTGCVGSIIGRGPSLQYLRQEHVGSGPVIVLNDGIVHVLKLDLNNDIYSMQRTGYDWAMTKVPDHVWLILQKRFSHKWFPEHTKRMLVDPVYFGLEPIEMAVRLSVKILQLWGCSKLDLICCDSLTTGDMHTFKSDSTVSEGTDGYYENVKPKVLKDLEEVDHEFITPLP